MTFVAALVLLCVALALIVSLAFGAARRRSEVGSDHSTPATGQVESELLRRPLRSRRTA